MPTFDDTTTQILPVKTSFPEVGTLIVPCHKPESFCTVLEMERRNEREFRILYLRISQGIKVRTVWYPSPEVFWKYYEEK